jgi:NAD(P)-dependent dehydrogenase (short-subunit alcohol dehydrogenase family)
VPFFITGRRQSELYAAVKQIGKNNVTGVQGDVSNLTDLDRLYAKVKEQKGRIGVLFANAGIVESAPLGSITEAHFDKIFSVNVKGLLFTVQKALPLFQDGDGGSIILTASVGGSKGNPQYCSQTNQTFLVLFWQPFVNVSFDALLRLFSNMCNISRYN